MTGRSSIPDPAARARIADAVTRAEAGTAGEIVVMLSARAGLYRSTLLQAALGLSLLTPWLLVWLTRWTPAAILLAQAALVAVLLAAGQLHPLRLALVPARLRRTRVREAAILAFQARGLAHTRGRTGLLLYVALAERHAEIVADAGVMERVGQETWREILTALGADLTAGRAEDGLTRAVERIGTCLAQALPAGPDDPDELPNRVVIAD